MAPTRSSNGRRNGVERVRDELLTALHFGRLTPGDRAPSVRRLADRTGLNRKTIHRAYTHLAREGFLEPRPGSGTFITGRPATEAPLEACVLAANRCRAAAEDLGLSPRVLAAFLDIYFGDGLRGLPIAVAECNHEQLGLIRTELEASLGVSVHPMLIADLGSGRRRPTSGCRGLVTTDCHLTEVSAMASAWSLSVHRVALDGAFPQRLAREARRADVVMVVRDGRFAPVFLRLLRQLRVPPGHLARFKIVNSREASRVLRAAVHPTCVHISPLVDASWIGPLDERFRSIRARWRIEPVSLQRLKAGLALDLASWRCSG